MIRRLPGRATVHSLAHAREVRTSPLPRAGGVVEDRRPSQIFVGRACELEALRTALAAAESGAGRVVTVAGEPGIGKSALLREFARAAAGRGGRVFVGTCYEGALVHAYEPLSIALGDYVRDSDLEELRVDLGSGGAAIAEILPVVRQRLPDLARLEPLPPDEGRTRLFEAMAQFLVAVSVRGPVVLMLDDLHWGDRDTLTMLRHMAHFVARHRLLLIGAYREEELGDNHPLEHMLAILRQESSYERLSLSGLAPEEISEFVQAVVAEWRSRIAPGNPPSSVPPDQVAPGWKLTLEHIRLETEGNPFFVRELVLDNLERGTLHLSGPSEPRWERLSTGGLPQGVRRVVGHRLRRLSRDANQLLAAGAGFDGPFRFDVVAEVAGLGEEASLRALDEVLPARILQPASGENRYDFTHALIRRATISRLNPTRRVQLHRRIAEALERLAPDRHDEIARHFHASRTLPHADRGVPHALAVANMAENRAAFGEVAHALRIALDMLPADDSRRGSLLGRLGLALAWTLEFEDAMGAIEQASERISSQKGRDAAADYLAEATRVLTLAGYQRGAWVCAERGLAEITSARRDWTWFWLAHSNLTRRRAENPDDPGIVLDSPNFRELARIARALPLTAVERTFVMPYFLPPTRRRAMEEKLTDLWVLPCYDDQRFALQVLEEGVRASEQRGLAGATVMYLAWLARAKTAAGDLAAAREILVRARALSARLIYPSIQEVNLLGAESDLLFALDEGLEEMSSRVDHTVLGRGAPEYNWTLAAVRAGMARGLAHLGRAREALALLPHLRTALESAPGWAMPVLRIACDAAAALWLLGRTDDSEPIETSLRERILPTDLREYSHDARLSLAQLCALRGRFGEAQEWFARARSVLDAQGARTLRALTDFDEALMFSRRAAAGDPERVRGLARLACEQFTALGMTGWIRRAEALLDPRVGSADDADAPRRAMPGERSPEENPEAIFRRAGDYWTVVYEGRESRLKDMRGLHYLSLLLASPGRELHATDLVRLSAMAPPGRRRAPIERAAASVRADLGDAGPSVDARAAATYARRLQDLRSELAGADECNDIGRAERIREEMAFLVGELGARRGHKTASHAERARVAVSKGIAAALRHIRSAAPDLAAHLDATIHRGYFCVYRPDPRRPVAWQC